MNKLTKSFQFRGIACHLVKQRRPLSSVAEDTRKPVCLVLGGGAGDKPIDHLLLSNMFFGYISNFPNSFTLLREFCHVRLINTGLPVRYWTSCCSEIC